MPDFTQAQRMAGLRTELPEDMLLFRSMSGYERLGRLFTYEVEATSPEHDIDFNDVLGTRASVWMELGSGDRRYFDGFVSRFTQTNVDPQGDAQYHLVLVPWLWLLTRTSDCRVFQDMTVPDIIEQIFADNGQSDYELHLTGSYRTWEYCVQYRETDFNFVSRLMEQEGITYFWWHEDGSHKLMLTDSPASYPTNPYVQQLEWLPPSEGRVGEEYISDWSPSQKLQPGKYRVTDYDFKAPGDDQTAAADLSGNHPYDDGEIYDYPGEYVNPHSPVAMKDDYARIRTEEQVAERIVTDAQTNSRGIATGFNFELTRHPRDNQLGEYLVIGASYHLTISSYRTGGGEEEERFDCSFQAIDSQTDYRPERRTPKPTIQGPQTAIVVGPSGEEIWTDEYGRIKVQFHWDRLGESNENSSCWIRVAQFWAGSNWGAQFLPRIGQEVMVEFLEGDPDCPLVTGRVYNADNMPPFSLPSNKTQSGIRTRSSKGGTPDNCNEIRFEDLFGSEQLFIHAEKNQDIEVENDESHWVGHDRTKTVDNDETTEIGHDRTENVGRDEVIDIGHDRTETVGNDENLTVGANQSERVTNDRQTEIGDNDALSVGKKRSVTVGKGRSTDVGDDDELQVGKNGTFTVGKKLTINAGDQITIKCGSATIVMKKSGDITIKGKNIKLQGSGKIDIKASGKLTGKGSQTAIN